tara:strand:- start:5219 stop:6679 length:1461 start_codon:yes stop_codon:yes gene_type:complete
MEYEAVIGLEVHVQLKTQSKMFTRARCAYGEAPNTLTNPVVMALPGALPVMNKEAIRKTVQVGLMLGCEIAQSCKWDRKNYFYPDSPKNYQISQYDQPICDGGFVEIEMPGPSRNVMGEHRKVKLTRIHLEEDVGKLTHYDGESLVDYNRAGRPLIEIVSEPDLFSADEAFAYLTSLRTHLLYLGVSDCDMEKGQLRCDANISVRPKGQKELGVKVEIKNLNSISGVRNGITYEIKRQIALCQKGEGASIVQETRSWDADKGITFSMRSKEMAHDYRYFPDPDLMPVRVSEEIKKTLADALPERPFAKQERFMKEYNLPYTITSVLCPDKALSDYFESAVKAHNNPKAIANFIANDLLRELSNAGCDMAHPLEGCKIQPEALAELAKLVDEGMISKQIAQDVLVIMFETGDAPEKIVEEKGLKQSSDTGELESICSEVIANNPKPVQEFKDGKDTAINALKGQVMKATKGKANPKMVDDILRKLLS